MKQQNLKPIRNYTQNPRSTHEGPDLNLRGDIHFDEFDYQNSPTKQSEAEACDINHIMKRYEATGFMPDHSGRKPQYDDFTTMETFHEAQQIVAEANQQFYALPAQVRAEFSNDPAKMLELVDKATAGQKAAIEKLVELGLATQKDVPVQDDPKGKTQSRQQAPKSEKHQENEGEHKD